jgi:hypothetical protein
MRGFTIFLVWIGVTLGTAYSHIKVSQINLFGRIVIFYGSTQLSRLLVFLIRNEYLVAGGTDIGPRKPAMRPAQDTNGKYHNQYCPRGEETR